ncbi:hypothetical protein GCM10007094_00570 [Pseudovibrio japonicus]|uniref:Lipoprotein n=1 Tax=Pseudovibrio japonicus TaxID=366534 RepID=A0ABQ3DW15_9HYPH|nr:hypothetical protein GCM10007094_00570 [Pseudovibrio japonicus]
MEASVIRYGILKIFSVLSMIVLAGCVANTTHGVPSGDVSQSSDDLSSNDDWVNTPVTVTTSSGAICNGVGGAVSCSDGSTGSYIGGSGVLTGTTTNGDTLFRTY